MAEYAADCWVEDEDGEAASPDLDAVGAVDVLCCAFVVEMYSAAGILVIANV